MATFYVLPPRSCLDEAVRTFLTRFLPGLPLPAEVWSIVVDHLAQVANWPEDTFWIPRDELPEGAVSEALVEGYGAEPGDQVVEVHLARPPRTTVVPHQPVALAPSSGGLS
ncbi:MAG: hypothetical protein RMJ56_05875 [Gemmataceae bacterium]|nr:hypothetical protein [Gemmata sp.]MDW8197117.1 hypothetical protein [Gemmataceae bacterium]